MQAWPRSRMIAIAIVVLLGAGAVAVGRPHAISEPVLGANWHCSRAAFVVTCTQPGNHPLASPHVAPARQRNA
jgi:hypothetical protein